MARIVPELVAEQFEDEGEARLYRAVQNLPEDYTVVYKYQFCDAVTGAVVWQADLVIIHPLRGYVVFKVHLGEVGFFNGRWHEYSQGAYRQMARDPLAQARSAAYAIARLYREKTGWNFPLSFDIGLCFPNCTKFQGLAPAFVKPGNLILGKDLDGLAVRVAEIFAALPRAGRDAGAIGRLTDILTASFKLYNTLEAQIRSFAHRAEHKFTQEQERILEETELNKRMVFYGAAGTGKTMLAVEKARRLAEAGKKVALTCFNKHLAGQFPADMENLTARHFHGLLEMFTGSKPPADPRAQHRYFEDELPRRGLEYFSGLPQEQKFDALIVDEGQDFRPHWFQCLAAMIKEDGEFYVFADPSQNIFNVDPAGLEALPASRFRLTVNLRNSASVCQRWIQPLSAARVRLGLKDCGEVHFHSWSTDSQQRRMLEREIRRLLERGIQPRRITILSPHRRENSCLAGVDSLAGCPLAEVGDPRPDALRFSTIRAFKGLESDVVLLIGVRPDSPVCSRPDLYVGGSRARYMLQIFHRDDWRLQGDE
ncbi:MAG TPA: AAA family ATPase [Bacillota bacterium]|nr:AAA family ATPase [Bacillota bacterium]HPZ90429.1 AAA family ATPase [Bacillota bacterium]HQE01669.1 AAA family ATPase [Bacillota bacterium]